MGVAGVALLLYVLVVWAVRDTEWRTGILITAGGVAVAAITAGATMYYHPDRRHWRLTVSLFGMAGVLALIPSLAVHLQWGDERTLTFISDASPFLVLGFLAAGVCTACLDVRSNRPAHTDRPPIQSVAPVGTVTNSPAGRGV